MNGRGGAREGAGRKKGACTRKTRAVADTLMEDGITPLHVMIDAMRDAYETAKAYPTGVQFAEQRLQAKGLALHAAEKAAPYMHPRLSSVDQNHSGNVGLTIEIVRFAEEEGGQTEPGRASVPQAAGEG